MSGAALASSFGHGGQGKQEEVIGARLLGRLGGAGGGLAGSGGHQSAGVVRTPSARLLLIVRDDAAILQGIGRSVFFIGRVLDLE